MSVLALNEKRLEVRRIGRRKRGTIKMMTLHSTIGRQIDVINIDLIRTLHLLNIKYCNSILNDIISECEAMLCQHQMLSARSHRFAERSTVL